MTPRHLPGPKPVEVVIACHSPERALGRAVSSVLDGNGAVASVTVVAHNVDPVVLASRIDPRHRETIHWLSLKDGTRSPANPYNFGTVRAHGTWVSLLGSDDFLEPGSISKWMELSPGADAVITREVHDGGALVRTPPIRPMRHRWRDSVKDRLFYRSAPLGLMRTSFLREHDLAWDSDLSAGGDLRLSTLLWARGRIAVQTEGPAYVVGGDAADRVTMRLAPLDDELRHVDLAWSEHGWATELNGPQRNALAIKYLRIHFFGAAYNRAIAQRWNPGDREILSQLIRLVIDEEPSSALPLSVADRQLLKALTDLSVPTERVNQLALARRRFGRPSTLFPRDPRYLLHREAPFRFMAASALMS